MLLRQSGTTNSCKISYLSSCKCGKEKFSCKCLESACGLNKAKRATPPFSVRYITHEFSTQELMTLQLAQTF